MKITRITTEVFEFDVEGEKKRLHTCFSGEQLQRQLDILHAVFEEKDLEKAQNLVFSLPRCPEHECSEAEYCGRWIDIFTGGGWGEKEMLVEEDILYKYE